MACRRTFKVVPSVFFQLYIIHFAFGNGVCPAAICCLLSEKSAATHERLHRDVKNLIPTAAPSSILVDFEKAAINTFSAVTQQLRYEAVTFICARMLCAKFPR